MAVCVRVWRRVSLNCVLSKLFHLTFSGPMAVVTDGTNRLNGHWTSVNQQYINQRFQLCEECLDSHRSLPLHSYFTVQVQNKRLSMKTDQHWGQCCIIHQYCGVIISWLHFCQSQGPVRGQPICSGLTHDYNLTFDW